MFEGQKKKASFEPSDGSVCLRERSGQGRSLWGFGCNGKPSESSKL